MKIRDLGWLQIILLLVGVIFAGWTLYGELVGKFWLQLCFYGFLMFLIACLIAIYVLRVKNKRSKLIWQKRLVAILSVGTLFSVVNFGLSACSFYNRRFCASTCRVGIDNPFSSPCFYGAVIFIICLWVAIKLYKKIKKG
jgi:hypothetical protein